MLTETLQRRFFVLALQQKVDGAHLEGTGLFSPLLALGQQLCSHIYPRRLSGGHRLLGGNASLSAPASVSYCPAIA